MSIESFPNGILPSNEISPWDDARIDGPYEGEYLDAEYTNKYKEVEETK